MSKDSRQIDKERKIKPGNEDFDSGSGRSGSDGKHSVNEERGGVYDNTRGYQPTKGSLDNDTPPAED